MKTNNSLPQKNAQGNFTLRMAFNLINLIGQEITVVDTGAGRVVHGTLEKSPDENMMFIRRIVTPANIWAAFNLDTIQEIKNGQITVSGMFV